MAKNGTMAAKIVENLVAPDATCAECSGENKGKPISRHGHLVGPEGRARRLERRQRLQAVRRTTKFKAKSVKLVDGGKKLEVTGCKAIFCRTATWVRAN